jgi:hypothetical protein
MKNKTAIVTGALVVYQIAEEFGAPPISQIAHV